MVSKKSARVAPKISSATALAASSQTATAIKTSILKSAFSPSLLQLSLFASVIQSLDSQQLRIHDTVSGQLKSEYTPSRSRINCLRWGYSKARSDATDPRPAKKKRRRNIASGSLDRDRGTAVVAIGTNQDGIELFSPLEAKIVGVLAPAHPHGTRDFRFRDYGADSEAWSLGGDGTLIQWNLDKHERMRTLLAPPESLNTLAFMHESILVASNSTFLFDPHVQQTTTSIPGYKDPIHSLLVSPQSRVGSENSTFLAAALASRYINVYDARSATLLGNLIADGDVEHLIFDEEELRSQDKSQGPLAAVTRNGKVDVFRDPFDNWTSVKSKGMDLKARLKQATRRPEASIQIIRPNESATQVSILDASFQDEDLVLALAEGSAEVSFERIPWRGEHGSLSLSGFIQRTKTKSNTFGAETVNGANDHGTIRVNEATAVVAQGIDVVDEEKLSEMQDVIEISSAEEESEEGEESETNSDIQPDAQNSAMTNGITPDKIDAPGAEDTMARDHESGGEEPTFGDMIRAKSIGTVDVSAALPAASEQSLVPAKEKLDVSANLAMGNALSQSLRTNDTALLETCLQYEDLQIVRATIERLNSDLAMTLLQKLAERLHNRPGRAGSLLVWVQWTLVAHGGYLSARPDVVKQLSSLHTSIRERARSLQPLLSLKGKLDMLEAQVNFRRSLQHRSARSLHQGDAHVPVVYVEGQEASSSESRNEEASPSPGALQDSIDKGIEESFDETDNSDENMFDTVADINDEEELDTEADDNSMIDREASESEVFDEESVDVEVDYDDVDGSAGEEEKGPAVTKFDGKGIDHRKGKKGR